MSGTLVLEAIQTAPPGESQSPEANENRLFYYREPSAPAVQVGRYDIHVGLGSATPSQLLLGALNHPKLRLKIPLRLTIEREGGWVIASFPELEEFGYGPHLTEAVEDFRQTLIELYGILKAKQDHLGPHLAYLWARLRDLIEES